jgi:hypothetical protein
VSLCAKPRDETETKLRFATGQTTKRAINTKRQQYLPDMNNIFLSLAQEDILLS